MTIQVALRNKAKESATILDNSVLKKYNTFIKRYNPVTRGNLDKFGELDMQLTGSSPLMLVYLKSSGLLLKDVRLAERKDLEIIRQKVPDFFLDSYVDFGLNLVSSKTDDYQINSVFAKSLAKDLKKVGINLKDDKLIPYNILEPKTNKNSSKGLVFKLSEEGKDTAKERVLNTADFKWDYNPFVSGLFRACLSWGGDCDCRNEHLADSNDYGRVVVVSGEATAQKFLENHTSKFQKEENEAITEIKKEYAKRKASLRIE